MNEVVLLEGYADLLADSLRAESYYAGVMPISIAHPSAGSRRADALQPSGVRAHRRRSRHRQPATNPFLASCWQRRFAAASERCDGPSRMRCRESTRSAISQEHVLPKLAPRTAEAAIDSRPSATRVSPATIAAAIGTPSSPYDHGCRSTNRVHSFVTRS